MPLVVFLCQLCYVFLLGWQSRNVNEGQYASAAGTSLALGVFGLTVTTLVIKAALLEPSVATIAGYLLAGPVGIVLSMWSHRKVFEK